jgi:hypothetical protein
MTLAEFLHQKLMNQSFPLDDLDLSVKDMQEWIDEYKAATYRANRVIAAYGLCDECYDKMCNEVI